MPVCVKPLDERQYTITSRMLMITHAIERCKDIERFKSKIKQIKRRLIIFVREYRKRNKNIHYELNARNRNQSKLTSFLLPGGFV